MKQIINPNSKFCKHNFSKTAGVKNVYQFTLTRFEPFTNIQLLPHIQHSDTRYKSGRLPLF